MIFDTLSPCKLNLFLYITNKRPDGYHNLQTLFVILNHGDKMHFETTDIDEIELLTDFGFPKEENLIYKAALALKKYCACKKGVKISIEKTLAQGGGLGGGSANAATVLLVLNKLWDLNLSEEELINIGAKLGADVPIFVFGRTAFAEGIGEKLSYKDYKNATYLVITPNCKVPTKKLFSSDKLVFTEKLSYEQLLAQDFKNVFTPVVVNEYPEVKELLDKLSLFGKAYMSGSGSSCFIEVQDKEQGQMIIEKLNLQNYNYFIADSVKLSPVLCDLKKI